MTVDTTRRLLGYRALLIALALTMGACAQKKPDNFEKTADGLLVAPTQSSAKRVRLQVISDRIVRVTAAPTDNLELPESLAVMAKPASGVNFTIESTDDGVVLKTAQVTAKVSR